MQKLRDTSDAGTLATVRRYATGTAPYLAIPVWDERRGAWIRLTVKRVHLQAAVASPGLVRASYEPDADGGADGTLVLNGGRNCWRLRNLVTGAGGSHITPWAMLGELEAWARGKRRALARRVDPAASKAERAAQKCDDDIRKLRKRLDHWKMRVSQPHNPVLDSPHLASDGLREMALAWHAQKPIRKALGIVAVAKLKRDEPRTWAAFYERVAVVIGRAVDSGQQYSTLHARKGGPERDQYLKWLYRYVGLERNPNQRDSWYTSDDVRRERYQESRAEWVTRTRARRELEAQIRSLEVLAASYRAGETAETATETMEVESC